MSAAALKLYERGTTTLLAEFDFGELAGPAESAELEFDVSNPGAANETASEVALAVEESIDGGVTWFEGGVNGYLTTRRCFQAKATGQDGDGIIPQTTGYTPVGVGARLYLDPIPADCLRECSAKLVIPAGNSTSSRKLRIIAVWSESVTPLGQGLFESGQRGVLSGTGDPMQTHLIQGGELTPTGTPDGNVQVAPVQWLARGVPAADYGGAVAISASSSGLARWVTLSLGVAWPPTQTASTPVTAPAPVDDRPAVPEGEAFLGWVSRDDGTISGADIFGDDALRAPFYLTIDGLDWTLGSGSALVDNRLIRKQFSQTGTATDDQITVLYLNPTTGSVSQVESGDLPGEPRAEPLWELTAVSGVITSRDLRRFIGAEVVEFAAFLPGAAVVNDAAYWMTPSTRSLHVKLPEGAEISVFGIGNRTTGELRAALEYWDGAAWTDLFSDPTQAPLLAFDATVLYARGFIPDAVTVPPNTRMRWRIASIPITGGSTDAADTFLRVRFEVAPL